MICKPTRKARFYIANELLGQFLQLPEGMRIASVRDSHEVHDATVFVVEGDELPAVAECAVIPWIRLWYCTVDGVTEFDRWDESDGPAYHPGEGHA